MLVPTILVGFVAIAQVLAIPKLGSRAANPRVVNQTTCNGKTYTYNTMAGYGFVASDFRDKYGDTVGGHGSSMAIDGSTWKTPRKGVYTGICYTLPDRGWNTNGTLNYQSRVHKWELTLNIMPAATVAKPSGPNIHLKYLDTILFTGPQGHPTTGLDGDFSGHITVPGFPDLPIATYTGDGFGRPGPGDKRIPTDSEGLVLASDGGFWVSDEYGPYIYKYNSKGKLVTAIRPPEAFIPRRNGTESWSADSPPLYNPTADPIPADNPTGRDNNHGFEGLTTGPQGKTLYALLQAATNQDGGLSSATETYTRMVQYDITTTPPTYVAEYVVPLPPYYNGKNKTAATSEFHYISPTQFMILARDSGAGHGQSSSTSVYRHIDIFDISNATNVKGAAADGPAGTVASSAGVLNPGITPAHYCSWLDFNDNAELGRFGVHNGGAQDAGLLNEKWESIAVVPALLNGPDEYIVFSFSDNDFVTQNGSLAGGTYPFADASGFNIDNQMLAFHVTLPAGSKPLVS